MNERRMHRQIHRWIAVAAVSLLLNGCTYYTEPWEFRWWFEQPTDQQSPADAGKAGVESGQSDSDTIESAGGRDNAAPSTGRAGTPDPARSQLSNNQLDARSLVFEFQQGFMDGNWAGGLDAEGGNLTEERLRYLESRRQNAAYRAGFDQGYRKGFYATGNGLGGDQGGGDGP